MHITTIAVLTALISGLILAYKMNKEAQKALYLRDTKGRFTDSTIRMYRPDYKNSFYGKPINYKLSK